MTINCRLCGSETSAMLTQRTLRQYDVRWFRCPQCDLLQTEEPYWLEQAYSSAIAALDTGAIARNIFCCRLTLAVGRVLKMPSAAPCLDFGGGHGVFTRMMRDVGWDFRWSDKYGPNIFARGFEGPTDVPYKLVTAFEVFEHLVNVRDELAKIFQPGHDFALVGTVLHTGPQADWWYFVPETGQHVALYSRQTMQHIGDTFGYQALCGKAYTLFVRRHLHVSGWRRAIVRRLLNWAWLAYGTGSLLAELRRGRSLTWKDHLALKNDR